MDTKIENEKAFHEAIKDNIKEVS